MKKIINTLLLAALVSSFSCEEVHRPERLLCADSEIRVQIRQEPGGGVVGYPRHYHLQNSTYQGWEDIKMTRILYDARRWCP